MLGLVSAALLAGCAGGGPVRLAADTTLYITRHGDRSGSDELLNEQGQARARALVAALEGEPLDAIYSPGIQRNLDTAAPLAEARGLTIERRPQEAPTARLASEAAGRAAIWIGNKGNIAEIWEVLGLPEPVGLEYGDLTVLRTDDAGRMSVERRRY
ncbi:histidine phosphatase family protein [Salipiger abyssi]|uniref:histidine phosphatase family protein n=1 Tax=Salipiger abyssi TaxID=1250539 RepID=UPI001F21712F|nr:histidine phosphatase family protein [Salipiger abyssi]